MLLRVGARSSGAGSVALVSESAFDREGRPPPVHKGARVSKGLTTRAARAINDAAAIAVINGTPLRSFYTFTLDGAARERLFNREITLGSEMRRVLEHLRDRFPGNGLSYIWVAECPGSDPNGFLGSDDRRAVPDRAGTDRPVVHVLGQRGGSAFQWNPHVHLVTNVTVPRADFDDYAASVERAWRHGFVHLERIRDPAASGRYLLKAVNYIGKGARDGSDQLPIQGRRYGISQDLRATEEVEWIDLGAVRHGFANVCDLFGGGARPFEHGYFTGRGLVYDAHTGLDVIRSDALRLVEHGTAILVGYPTERASNG